MKSRIIPNIIWALAFITVILLLIGVIKTFFWG